MPKWSIFLHFSPNFPEYKGVLRPPGAKYSSHPASNHYETHSPFRFQQTFPPNYLRKRTIYENGLSYFGQSDNRQPLDTLTTNTHNYPHLPFSQSPLAGHEQYVHSLFITSPCFFEEFFEGAYLVIIGGAFTDLPFHKAVSGLS